MSARRQHPPTLVPKKSTSQAICVLLTLVSRRHMTNPLIVTGVSFWYVLVCLAQIAWSPAFVYEKIYLSAVFMGCILLPLAMIASGQYHVVTKSLVLETNANGETGNLIWSDYWPFQFPFELHLGWIIPAFAVNLNACVVAYDGSTSTQVFVAAVLLLVLAIVSFSCLLVVKRPQFTIPAVAAWATVCEL